MTLTVADVGHSIGAVRLRLFDPNGSLVSDDQACPGSVQVRLPNTGTYTALVSSCSGPRTGRYTITWRPSTCAATAPRGQLAYVANADSGNVSVIDPTTNATKAVIPVASAGQAAVATPMGIAISPNGGFAYVTYANSSLASVINTSTNVVTASIPVGLQTAGIAISPDGALAYTLSDNLGGVAVIDTKTNKVTQVIGPPDLGASQTITTSPDGAFLYVISDDFGGGGLVTIDTADGNVASFTPLDLGLYDAFAISPNGSFAYAGTLDGIVVIDTATNMPVATISLGEPFSIAFTPDNRYAYVSSPDDATVKVIDTSTGNVTATIPVGVNPGGVTISPDGSLAYVTDFTAGANDAGLSIIDTATNRAIAALPTLGDGPTSLALTLPPPGLCVGDAQFETKVTVDELVLSVNYALNTCPGRFPATSVPVP